MKSQFHRTIVLVLFTALALQSSAAIDPSAPVDVTAYKGPIRVACLGDSITHGVGATPGNAYPEQLDRMLGERFDVRNFGHSGASVAKGEKHNIWGTKEYKTALLFHPDVVVIMLGTNDTKPENWAFKKDFPKLYKELVTSFQKLSSKPRVFCCTPPYVGKKGNFGINEAGVLEQIPLITEVAAAWGAGVIDVHAALDRRDELFKDNVHPSTEGATLIAKAVYQSLTGNAWDGELPRVSSTDKPKPLVREIENPGELSYREAFALIASAGMPADKLQPIKERFDETAQAVEARIADYESQIGENDSQRMKFKKSDPKKSGEFKRVESELKKDLVEYKRDQLYELIALIPQDFRDEFGTEWVMKYVVDRLAPISSTLTGAQRKQIRALCRKDGAAVGSIGNTPERSIEHIETYKAVYDQVLDTDQKKRVEPF